MFKKVYIEITNACNLACSFCVKSKRKKEYMSLLNFNKILNKLKGYTNYLYLHVLGEPLLHPNINEMINIAYKKGFNINITTNGTLLEKITNNKHIRQVNISLHSINNVNELDNIFKYSEELLKNNTIVNYRLWIKDNKYDLIIKRINEYFNTNVSNNNKIKNNMFIDFGEEFSWPSLDNKEKYTGSCRGTIDHIGILVDGTIIPCCLDYDGIINLGNIYKESIKDVLNKEEFIKINKGFKENKRIHPLCKKCNFYNVKNM